MMSENAVADGGETRSQQTPSSVGKVRVRRPAEPVALPAGRLSQDVGGTLQLTTYGASLAGVEVRIDGDVIALVGDGEVGQPSNLLLNLNQIANADFSEGFRHWLIRAEPGIECGSGVNLAELWTCEESDTAFVSNLKNGPPVEIVYRDPVDGEFVPVTPGTTYRASIYLAVHRCRAEFALEFYSAEREYLTSSNDMVRAALGGRSLADYHHARAGAVAPDKAAFVRVVIRQAPMDDDNYVFFLLPWFGQTGGDEESGWDLAQSEATETAALRRCGGIGQTMQVSLDRRWLDGRLHEIKAIDRASARHLLGSPLSFRISLAVSGRIEGLDGTTVVGLVRDPQRFGPVPLSLWIDGREVSQGTAEETTIEGSFRFRLAIPRESCDGRPHHIEVRTRPQAALVGEAAEVTPALLTPWTALQQHAGIKLPPMAAPAAERRYESMRAWLVALGKAEGMRRTALAAGIAQLGMLHEVLLQGFEGRRCFPRFALPKVKAPKVSVVIPAHNKFAVTYNCLAALAFAYSDASFEVIVVDDGSSDETLGLHDIVANVICVRNDAPQGFVRACNAGAALASGEYIVMLNNDTEPTAGWLDELLFAFDHFDGVGMAGAKLLYADGTLQEAGGIVWAGGNPWNYGRGGNARDPRYNYSRQVDYLSGAAVMLRRTVWESVGGFSDEFAPAYFEDTDLAFKVRAKGLKTFYVPTSIVYHFEGISNGISTTSGTKRFQEVNSPKFKRKWATACRHNGKEGEDLELNKDRGVLYRALVVDGEMPRPDMSAGGYAALQEMRLLQDLEFKVTFIPMNLAHMGGYTEQLQRIGVETLFAPFATSVEQVLEERGHEFDIVYVTRYNVANAVLPAIRRLAPRAKVLFCNADLHFLREMRAAIAAKNEDMIAAAKHTKEQELEIMRSVDVTLSYNRIEHEIIKSHNFDKSKVALCPWVAETHDNIRKLEGRRDIAFIGGFGHPPNAEAVKYFVSEIMPLIRIGRTKLKFRVYGSNVPPEIYALASSDVIVEGYVDDVSLVYNSCLVFVAPLMSGAGIKGKVISALAHGTPCVLSPIAAEGTEIRDAVDAFVANTPEEWVSAIEAVTSNEKQWREISQNAIDLCRRYYSRDRGKILMREAIVQSGLYS